jgi:hypothetical protein
MKERLPYFAGLATIFDEMRLISKNALLATVAAATLVTVPSANAGTCYVNVAGG